MSWEKVAFDPAPKNPAPTSTDAPTFTAVENPAPIVKVDEVDTAVVSPFGALVWLGMS